MIWTSEVSAKRENGSDNTEIKFQCSRNANSKLNSTRQWGWAGLYSVMYKCQALEKMAMGKTRFIS